MARTRALLPFLLGALVIAFGFGAPARPTRAQPAPPCQFALGFKALHDLIPDRVGDCQDNESHNSENGDGLQHTSAWHGKGGPALGRETRPLGPLIHVVAPSVKAVQLSALRQTSSPPCP